MSGGSAAGGSAAGRFASGGEVVLLDEHGAAVGAALKSAVHYEATPLHLAFSCYVFDAAGSLLVTQRARAKATWPGVWTNSFCGHPSPGEKIVAAVIRHALDELGIRLDTLWPVLPSFRYRAVMPNGIVENEICPVFAATTADPPTPDTTEVGGFEWVPWLMFRDDVLTRRRSVSPWCVEQVEQFASWPDDPLAWPAADWTAMPPAVLAAAG